LSSADDAVDLELRIALAVPLMPVIVLAPSHLEDLHLLAATMRENRGFHGNAGERWLPEANVRPLADEQDVAKANFRTNLGRKLFHLEFFTRGDPVLLAAALDDRIHGETPQALEPQKGCDFSVLAWRCQNGTAAAKLPGPIG